MSTGGATGGGEVEAEAARPLAPGVPAVPPVPCRPKHGTICRAVPPTGPVFQARPGPPFVPCRPGPPRVGPGRAWAVPAVLRAGPKKPGPSPSSRYRARGSCWGGAGAGARLPPCSRSGYRCCAAETSRLYTLIFRQLQICHAQSYADDLWVASAQSSTVVQSRLLAAEREEAKAVLSLFLRQKGLRSTLAARIVNKSDGFIEHLVSKLRITYRSRYAEGRELSTPEIRDALLPYLEALSKKHGDGLVEVVENFPDPLAVEREALSSSMVLTPTGSNKQKAIARVSTPTSGGALPELVLYLLELGMNHEEIKNVVRKFPAFAYYNVDRKIKPLVELLLELGVPRSNIPGIIKKRPQLCGISLSDNLKPTMAYLESIGVNKGQWSKVICRFPAFLTYSRQKVETTVSFLTELGVSKKNIGKILTRCPHLTSYSVNDNLRPTAEYFRSIGADAASLIQKSPQAFGLNVEAKLKPITEFFLEREFSIEEIGTMVNRFGIIHTLSLEENLLPKYEFFLTMEYPRYELVKFPQYFGYSLEQRIKPRYARMTGCGVRLILNQLLSVSDSRFHEILRKKMDRV